jgi:hypothetical protein
VREARWESAEASFSAGWSEVGVIVSATSSTELTANASKKLARSGYCTRIVPLSCLSY